LEIDASGIRTNWIFLTDKILYGLACPTQNVYWPNPNKDCWPRLIIAKAQNSEVN